LLVNLLEEQLQLLIAEPELIGQLLDFRQLQVAHIGSADKQLLHSAVEGRRLDSIVNTHRL
jgi:hypothetical protein